MSLNLINYALRNHKEANSQYLGDLRELRELMLQAAGEHCGVRTAEWLQQFLHEETGVKFLTVEISQIVELYPEANAYAFAYGGEDVRTKDKTLEVFSLFFLGCPWPDFGERHYSAPDTAIAAEDAGKYVDMRELRRVFANEVKLAGYGAQFDPT